MGRIGWIALGLVFFAGCGPAEDTPDAGGPDVGVDATPDGALDGPPPLEADTGGGDARVDPDARPDAMPDAILDVASDAAPDAMPDMASDTISDAILDMARQPDATPDATPDAILDMAPQPDAAPDAAAVVDMAPEPDAFIEPEPDCRVDGDCAAGEICADGICFRPPDGTCQGPFTAVVGEVYEGRTGGIGTDGGSCPGNNDLTAPEDIYRIVFPDDGPYCVNTRGSAFDTMLYIRTSCGDPRTEVACRDDDFAINGPGGWSALTFEPEAFRAYYVTVDGYGSPGDAPRAGDYRLSVTAGACQPPPECRPETEAADCGPDRRCADGRCVECVGNGDCPGGRCAENVCRGCLDDADCPADGRCVDAVCEVAVGAGGSCAAPVEALPGVRYVGETAGIGVEVGSCGAINDAVDAPEAVFAFTAPRDGRWCASTAGSALDTVLYVRLDCGAPQTEVDCSDDEFDLTGGPQGALDFEASAGEAFAVIVDGFALPGDGEAGPFALRINEGPCAAP